MIIICKKCNIESEIESGKICKVCIINRRKEYYKNNKEKILEYSNVYNNNRRTKDTIKKYNALYQAENKEKIKEKNRIRYRENKIKYQKYYQENIEKIKSNQEKHNKKRCESRLKNKPENITENIKLYNKNYRLKNKEKLNEYTKNRINSNPLLKLTKNIRTLLYFTIKRGGYKKRSKSVIILGCSFDDFKKYLESKFESWMSWENYGKYNGELNYGWDIDHIIPISLAQTEEEIVKLNHYTNLQPLCSYNNRCKKKDSRN